MILSRFVALFVSLIQKVSLFQSTLDKVVRSLVDGEDAPLKAKLEAKQAVVRCRAADAEKVKQAMQQAQTSMPGVALKLDEHEFLPAAPACAGGVHVISVDGKIVCNNSLDDRLRVAFERGAPEIRRAIFGANPNIHVKT